MSASYCAFAQSKLASAAVIALCCAEVSLSKALQAAALLLTVGIDGDGQVSAFRLAAPWLGSSSGLSFGNCLTTAANGSLVHFCGAAGVVADVPADGDVLADVPEDGDVDAFLPGAFVPDAVADVDG